MTYSDEQRIEKIRTTTEKLITYLHNENITTEMILEQEPIRWTITTPLYNIGEHVYYLSSEYKTAHPDIPWAKISGLRHRLVHDYDNTNWSLICTILFDILPKFLNDIQNISN